MKTEDVNSGTSESEPMAAVVRQLARNCSVNDVQDKNELITRTVEVLIQDYDPYHHSLFGLVSILESLSVLLCKARMIRRLDSHSLATRIFLAWHAADVVLRDSCQPARVAFGHFVFIACVKCIGYLSQEVGYVIVPLRQTTPSKKSSTGWTTPTCQKIKTFSTVDEESSSSSNAETEKVFDISKLLHCVFIIQSFALTESITKWIPHFRDPQLPELIVLAQICLLSENTNSSANLVCSARFSLDVSFRFLNGAVQLCQRNLNDALESIISIIRDNRDEFYRDALHPADGVSMYLSGGNFELVADSPIMLQCVRLIIACLSAVYFPVSARIALCQYAWPKLHSEFMTLVAAHVTDNRLFEFELFREQILQTEMVDTFLALHRGGKLHMKLGVPQAKQGGRLLRGASRNLSITTERDLEDHIVYCGNKVQLIGPVLFSLITSDIYTYVSNRDHHTSQS